MKKEKGKEMKKNKNLIVDYLKLPYTRIILPDSETGTFTAEILEFPGCISEGKTIEETYERLERVAESWIEAALSLGQTIPKPSIIQGVGGKIVLRLPKSLHRQLTIISERENTSLNQFILSAISEKVGATNIANEIVQKIVNQIPVFRLNQAQFGKEEKKGTDANHLLPFEIENIFNKTAANMVN
jgi:predicted RNase H-like HicB family nuclease